MNVRLGIGATGNGVEAPSKGDAFAAVKYLEDGEILRDRVSSRCLGSLLLVNQVLFTVDRGRLRS
jgi:hypothetical protein